MLNRIFTRLAFALGISVMTSSSALAQPVAQTGYAAVNGLEMYYEVHGSGGTPLILLHGGLLHGGIAASETFAPLIPELSAGRQVIAVHLHGHGHTVDIDRPLSYELMADDVAALIEHLDIEQADLLGYSLGGGVALQTAIRHPELVRKLVVVSMAARSTGQYPEVLAAFEQMPANAPMIAEGMRQSPLSTMYPNVDWAVLFTKMANMENAGFDWSADMAKITALTMLVFADADSILPEHMVEMWKLLGGGQRDAGLDGSLRPVARLAILPGTTHYDVLSSPLLIGAVMPFLDAPMPASTSAPR